MPYIVDKRFQSDQPILEPKPNAETHTGLVRSAENPRIASRQRVRPQRPLAHIKRDVGRPNSHDGALCIPHRMDRLERRRQLGSIDLLFGPPALKTGLCLGHAILDRLNAVATRKRAPGSDPEALQDGVGIDENGTLVASHWTSQLDRGLYPMRREEIGEIVNCQVQQCARPAR